MRYVLLLASLVAFIAIACDDGDDSGSQPTSTAPPEATATLEPTTAETPEAGGVDGFRNFALQIEQALADEDPSFFTERAVLQELQCTGTPSGIGGLPCDDEPAGVTLRGIPGVPWASDGFTIFAEEEEYGEWLSDYFDGALADESDDHGSGALLLHALVQSAVLDLERGQEAVFGAVTSILADPNVITGEPPGMPSRDSRVLSFRFEDGRWLFLGELDGATGWLSEDCGPCEFAFWERWEGNAAG